MKITAILMALTITPHIIFSIWSMPESECPKGFAKYIPEQDAFCPCVFYSEYTQTKDVRFLISTKDQKLALSLTE